MLKSSADTHHVEISSALSSRFVKRLKHESRQRRLSSKKRKREEGKSSF